MSHFVPAPIRDGDHVPAFDAPPLLPAYADDIDRDEWLRMLRDAHAAH
jgi:hypothetical protein